MFHKSPTSGIQIDPTALLKQEIPEVFISDRHKTIQWLRTIIEWEAIGVLRQWPVESQGRGLLGRQACAILTNFRLGLCKFGFSRPWLPERHMLSEQPRCLFQVRYLRVHQDCANANAFHLH